MLTKRIYVIIFLFFFPIFSFSQEKADKKDIDYISSIVPLNQFEIDYLMNHNNETINIVAFLKNNVIDVDTKSFIHQVIKHLSSIKNEIVYTKENYPGKDLGYPFEWWKDENWMKKNIKFGF